MDPCATRAANKFYYNTTVNPGGSEAARGRVYAKI